MEAYAGGVQSATMFGFCRGGGGGAQNFFSPYRREGEVKNKISNNFNHPLSVTIEHSVRLRRSQVC